MIGVEINEIENKKGIEKTQRNQKFDLWKDQQNWQNLLDWLKKKEN